MNVLLKAYVDRVLKGVEYNVDTAVEQLPDNRLDNQRFFSILREENIKDLCLHKLLYYTMTFDATEHKDHIFGIKGIWEKIRPSSPGQPGIQVDYAKEKNAVYSEATILAIRDAKGLDILALVQDPMSRSPQERLATWIPDYSSGPKMYPLSLDLKQSAESVQWNASQGLDFTAPDGCKELPVDGIELDEVVQVGPKHTEFMNHFQVNKLLEILALYPHRQYPSNESYSDAFWKTLIKDTFRDLPAGKDAREAFPAFIMKRVQELDSHIENLAEAIRVLPGGQEETAEMTIDVRIEKIENLVETVELFPEDQVIMGETTVDFRVERVANLVEAIEVFPESQVAMAEGIADPRKVENLVETIEVFPEGQVAVGETTVDSRIEKVEKERQDAAKAFVKQRGDLKDTLDELSSRINPHKQEPYPSASETERLISIAEKEGTEEEKELEGRRIAMEESLRIAYIGRRIFVTRQGYFGITSESVSIGDKAWILAGARTPFVLRIKDPEQKKWRVVGEAYVHGVMKGEAAVGEPLRILLV
jgi:hypothetical protein